MLVTMTGIVTSSIISAISEGVSLGILIYAISRDKKVVTIPKNKR